jgi:hypothetical protein
VEVVGGEEHQKGDEEVEEQKKGEEEVEEQKKGETTWLLSPVDLNLHLIFQQI